MISLTSSIAIILGKQWHEETQETKNRFKEMADTIKQQHQQNHPDYQYQPRKPSEKKRRMTRQKAAALDPASETSTEEPGLESSTTAAAPATTPTISPQEDAAVIPSLASIGMPADNMHAEAAVTVAEDPVEHAGGEEIQGEGGNVRGWVEQGNDTVAAHIPLDANDLALYNLLKDFNEQVESPGPRAIYPEDEEDNGEAVLGYRLTEYSQYEEDFIASLVNWEQVEKDAAENKASVAADYNLLQGH